MADVGYRCFHDRGVASTFCDVAASVEGVLAGMTPSSGWGLVRVGTPREVGDIPSKFG